MASVLRLPPAPCTLRTLLRRHSGLRCQRRRPMLRSVVLQKIEGDFAATLALSIEWAAYRNAGDGYILVVAVY